PGLKRLLADIEADKIDIVIVYKIDRLTRSLLDFAQLNELFDRHKVSFVSVTQQFNTTTSMGRLVLNILLSFAQFERELTGERIRDKFLASKKKGMWMGGCPPLGYDVVNRKLVVNEKEAALVIKIFRRFITLRSITLIVRELRLEGITSKTYVTLEGKQRYGTPLCKNQIYRMLRNRLYLGEMPHKGNSYPGQHESIIDKTLWNEAHEVLKENPRVRARKSASKTTALLQGLAYCSCGSIMTPTYTRKQGRLYRYYKPSHQLRGHGDNCQIGCVSAGELEGVVVEQLLRVFFHPDIILKTWSAAKNMGSDLTENNVRQSLKDIAPVWNQLFPAEQSRLINLLIEKIDVGTKGVSIKFRTVGIENLVRDFTSYQERLEAA
ncbi:MAG: recombinase family protein, partial [Alphaproteobacteria bacterium]|nr:recombinase family protein [Alphaproteobacteria bacterium]